MTNNVETALSYLSQIRKVYAERLNIKFQEENFSPNEISVLILLSNNKSINTSRQLTTILGVSKSLVSRSLAALERKGLIQTREASGDRRSREIYLTASASAVTKQLSEGIKEINEVVLADISEEEMRMMKETMEKIIDRFKAASAKTAKGE
mgnify:FL=1